MIKENPRSPTDIWFAIGLCYFRLGNLPKAKLSMDKTIADDPENSMALTALGIIEIAANLTDFESRGKACEYFERAFAANPRNPLCLKYLAEHFFMIDQHDFAKEFAEVGLHVLQSKTRSERAEIATFRQEIEILRSQFYFILGKIEHAQERYSEALNQYEKSLSHFDKNYQTHFCLAKVHFKMHNYSQAEKNLAAVLSCHQFKDSYEALKILAQIKAR